MRVDFLSPPQHASFVELLRELHAYYHEGASVPQEMVRVHLVDKLLGPDSPLRLVVADDGDDHVLGFAAISLTYSLVEPSPEEGRHCQLKELYVRSSERSRGVGQAIMAWVARYAVAHGCRRVDWPVRATNARGIAFYKGLGAQQVVERLSFRLSEPGLGELARQCEGAHAAGSLTASPGCEA